MRVENVGSLSPAADLLAFFIAIILTLGALSTLEIDHKVDENHDHVSLLDDVLDSGLLDPDDDGYLEIPGEGSFSTDPIPVEEAVFTIIEWSDGEVEMIIFEGMIFHPPDDYELISSVHSFTVTVELDDGICPGLVSISIMEVWN